MDDREARVDEELKYETSHDREEKEDAKEEKVRLVDGVRISRGTLREMAGGAMGALVVLGLGKSFKTVRPLAVGVVREGYAFKEWLAGRIERIKENVEDVVAEGVFSYYSDTAAASDAVKREQELLDRIEKIVEERSASAKGEKKE